MLQQASDEGPLGLWEPLWWANNVLSDLPFEDRVSWSADVLHSLLSVKAIRLWRKDNAPHPSPTDTELSDEEARSVIDGRHWTGVPLEPPIIWFETTPDGDRLIEEAIESGEFLGEETVERGWTGPSPQANDR